MNAWNVVGEIRFVSPWTLLWGVAAVIPVVLHLYGRLTLRTIDFPATCFLFDEPTPYPRPGRRLSKPWRLAMRCTVILLVVIAAAMTETAPTRTGTSTQTDVATEPTTGTTESTDMTPIRTLLIGPDSVPGTAIPALRWAAAAIAPLGDDGPVTLTRKTPAAILTEPLEQFDSVWLVDPRRPDDVIAAVLRQYVESGGCVILFVGKEWGVAETGTEHQASSPTGTDVYDPGMETWLPATIGSLHTRALRATTGDSVYGDYTTGAAERADTAEQSAEFPILRWRELASVKTRHIRWRSAEGIPLLVEAMCGRGCVMLFAFGLTPADTPLVVLPEFVPLIQETLRRPYYLRHPATTIASANFANQTDSTSSAAIHSDRTMPWWKSTPTWLFAAAISLWICTLFPNYSCDRSRRTSQPMQNSRPW